MPNPFINVSPLEWEKIFMDSDHFETVNLLKVDTVYHLKMDITHARVTKV